MYKLYSLAILFFIITGCSKQKKSDRAGRKMQKFVVDISNYAKIYNPNFIIVPQNGVELAFESLNPNNEPYSEYMNAVDGFGIEELFYNEIALEKDERFSMLQELSKTKKILVADYLSNDVDVSNAINENLKEGFICFPRGKNNYDYLQIPDSVIRENTGDILNLTEAKNYLYLISNTNFNFKQEMMDAISKTNFDVVLIDLFFNDVAFTRQEIEQLRVKNNGSKRLVISYMNIGAAESYRYYWKKNWRLHLPNWLKKKYEGYNDEVWVKFWKKQWQEIIYGNDNSYTKKIIDAGFDGVYLDNVEAYYFLYFDE